ncbi:MAG TPA: peptidoglycan-binding domain-containing protein [Candidatus Limiplasma sp.]|nr:peptidoglycan-binding domain-containing protein [Candidatus Limiplasma sp.]
MGEQMNRAVVPFTNEHFMAFCEKMIGQPYWMGCCLYKATNSLLSRKTNQYSSSYTASRTARYKKDIAAKKVVADCIGAAKGYAWTGGGIGVLDAIGADAAYASKYGSNGCPDKGANSMFTYAKSKGVDWGAIGTLPEIVGLALYKSGHVGYYVGNGYAIEWKGFSYGCVKTKVAGRGWTHWYKLPFIQYGDVSIPETGDNPSTVDPNARTLRYTKGRAMLRGEDVLAVQARLIELGFDPGKADSVYGPMTAAAVAVFQTSLQIESDGIVGTITRHALG